MGFTIAFGAGTNIVSGTWTDVKTTVSAKVLSLQYAQAPGSYTIFAIDDSLAYTCTIWTGAVPDGVISSGYSQAQNDTDKSDFETNYKPYANMPIAQGQFNDPRIRRCIGNLTATSTSEVLVSSRPYVEQSSQAQRSVKSSSTQDAVGGTGAAAVRITYLDSNYALKTEDITLQGTTRVSTVGTDIRFIDKFEVIRGAAAVGAISLLDSPSGAQNEFCGISAGTTEAFMCHHYVPAGKQVFVMRWGATVDDEAKFKLNGQLRFGTNLVDRILDLDNLMNGNATPPNRIAFERSPSGVFVPEKTYIRTTVVPNQATTTTIRSFMELWETPS